MSQHQEVGAAAPDVQNELAALAEQAQDRPGVAAVMEIYRERAQTIAQINAYLGYQYQMPASGTSNSSAW